MKRVIFMAMVILSIGSWFFTVANGADTHEAYIGYLDAADKYLSKKIYVDAIDCVKKAIEIYPNILENKMRLADIYKEARMYRSFEAYCLELIDKYRGNEEIICILGDYYVQEKKEEKAISLYKSYLSKYENKKTAAKKLNELKSAFYIDYNGYSYISAFHNGCAVFKKGDKYGIMNSYGDVRVKAFYDYAGVFSISESLRLAPVSQEGEYFYIDTEGNRRLKADIEYDYLGSFSKNGMAVFKRDNYYGYLDSEFNEFKNKYEYACSFYENSVSAVKEGNNWILINDSLNRTDDELYDEIKTDDLGCAVHCQIIFAKREGKYMMLDINGNKITEPMFDDVDFFTAPNEINNKWGFIDRDGNIVIKPKYDNAFSFSCGFAPVLIEEKWGYIDMSENLAISPRFNMAKPFNSSGTAPVLKSEWQLLKLKYYEKGIN